ncbi:MAG: energy-coupling factor transporter transmembrane protein EcfT [Theionarchaea archaeon]|nr:energy-coupling factor transporter transmembrane protein EcfT [Theionarchaea archaeon]
MRRIGFVQGNSPAHRLDPLAKIAILLSFCLVALGSRNGVTVVVALAAVLLLIWTMGLGLFSSIQKVRTIVWLCILLFVLQVLFVKTGRPVVARSTTVFGHGITLIITSGGIGSGVLVSSRLLTIIFSSLFFVSTTDPSRLAYSLMHRGFPYRYGFMLVLSMRFLPMFQLEASHVRRAQIARGLKIDSPGPWNLYRMARYTFMPLIVSALARIGTVTASMEARGFGIGTRRTFLRESRFRYYDWAAVGTSIFLSTVTLLILG